MKTYTTLTPVQHNGDRYAEGDSIELSAKAARPLLEAGAIADPEAMDAEAAAQAQAEAEAQAAAKAAADASAPAPRNAAHRSKG